MGWRYAVLALACVSCGRFSFDARPTDAGGDDGIDLDGATDDGGDAVTLVPLVQRVDLMMDATVKTATIMAVDPTRTIVLCDFALSSSAAAHQPMCELVDATTVRAQSGFADPLVHVSMQVVQLPAGVTVQRGVHDVPMFVSDQLTIQPVDLAHSFVLASRWTDANTSLTDPAVTPITRLVSANTLQFDRLAPSSALHVSWQVVTWPAASVQTGTDTITDGINGTAIAAGITSRDDTFMVAGAEASNALELDYMVRAELSFGLNRSFTRIGSAGTIDVAWSTVETSEVRVQHGVTSMGALATATATITAPADLSRTFVLLSFEGGRLAEDSDYDNVRCVGSIAGNQLSLTRGATMVADVTGFVGWEIVEL